MSINEYGTLIAPGLYYRSDPEFNLDYALSFYKGTLTAKKNQLKKDIGNSFTNTSYKHWALWKIQYYIKELASKFKNYNIKEGISYNEYYVYYYGNKTYPDVTTFSIDAEFPKKHIEKYKNVNWDRT
jgi:hypothetical protein